MQPASDQCSQGNQAPSTPARRQRQTALPFAVTPRSTPSQTQRSPCSPSQTPSQTQSSPYARDQAFVGPALKKLMLSARSNPDLSSLIQKVVEEQNDLCKSQRKPGELAPKPLNLGGAREAKPGAERSGRPPDPRGPRVGVQGYLTPDAKKNSRPEGQTILRRDVSAPARLRMASAISKEGVQTKQDLQKLLPQTWRRLELQFARSGTSNGFSRSRGHRAGRPRCRPA